MNSFYFHFAFDIVVMNTRQQANSVFRKILCVSLNQVGKLLNVLCYGYFNNRKVCLYVH